MQSEGDIPFDLRHHRFLKYLNNDESRTKLTGELNKWPSTLAIKPPPFDMATTKRTTPTPYTLASQAIGDIISKQPTKAVPDLLLSVDMK